MPRQKKPTPEQKAELDKLDAALDSAVEAGVSPDQAIRKLLANDTLMTPLINAAYKQARAGNIQALKFLIERGFGTVKQQHEVSGSLSITDLFADPTDETNSDFSLDQ